MIQRLQRKSFAALIAIAFSAVMAIPAAAEDIRLVQRDGTAIVGHLKMFADGIYEIETVGGLKRIPVSNVIRIEPATTPPAAPSQPLAAVAPPAKPSAAKPVSTGEPLLLSGSRSLGESTVRPLLEAYAQQAGGSNPMWAQKGSAGERTFQTQLAPGRNFSATMSLRGDAQAIEDLIKGTAQIAMLERPLTPAEAKRLTASGLGDPLADGHEAVIAPGAVVVIVHPSNPVKSLSFAQVSGIFSGRIRNWSEVGGPSRRIQVLAPSPGSPSLDVAELSFGPSFDVMASARRLPSSLETADLVAADPAAIGLVQYGDRGNTAALSLTNGCGLTFEPTSFAITSETYPLVTRFSLQTTVKASASARDFLDFATSPAAQAGLKERGLPNLMPVVAGKGTVRFDRIQAGIYPDASARFLDVAAGFVENASRTSLTLRYDGGSDRLDARAVADLDRLLQFASSSALGNRKFALVGYAESTGNFAADVAKAKARAVAVSEVLQRKGLTIERLFGFGPLMPVECQGSELNVQRSRRVEVWVE